MARKPSPWYWEQLQEWCVELGGKRHRLGKNPATAPPPKKRAGKWIVPKEIDDAFHKLMAKETELIVPGDTVKAVMDQYLEWVKDNRAERTYSWYLHHLKGFLSSLKPPLLRVVALEARHVEAHIKGKDWEPGYIRGLMIAIQTSLNWAANRNYIARNPLKGVLKKPTARRREVVIPDEHYKKMLKLSNDGFRDLIETAWITGARPQELIGVEARHVDLKNARWVFPIEEAKGKRKQRIVYLSDKALAITKRLVKEHPEGKLFRRQDGEAWGRHDVHQHFGRLKKKLGMKYRLYDFRHTFITNGLKNGVDPVTMANLVGHVDLKMIHEIYNHTMQDTNFMRKAAKRATSGASA